jgi:hypothetical protein
VRFLIDRCAGKRLADWLRQQEHDVLESQERGADPRIALIEVILERHEADLLSGAVITVKGDRIRISRSQS